MSGFEWPSAVALVVSVLALGLSWMAYRQRVRYHPQPRLVASWDRPALDHFGIPVRQVGVTNHGNDVARDMVALVTSSARGRKMWDKRAELAPGDTWWLMVPSVSGADWSPGARDLVFWTEDDGGGRAVRPEVAIEWRQAPFAAGKRRRRFRGPREEGV